MRAKTGENGEVTNFNNGKYKDSLTNRSDQSPRSARSEISSSKPVGNGGESMRYPIVIHKDETSDYGVVFPDLPGCFSAGDTIEEAIIVSAY